MAVCHCVHAAHWALLVRRDVPRRRIDRICGAPRQGPADSTLDALAWLAKHGNPYVASLSDTQGLVGIDFGVYGVPETFVIDKSGTIRLKHIGPVTPEVLRDTILPLVKKLNA